MLAKFGQIGSKRRLGSILVLLVILPAVFFSVYEFSTLSASEELIAEVYRQQLDVVLFSLNQYSWDVANSWANAIDEILSPNPTTEKERASLLASFLRDNAAIQGLFIAYEGSHSPRIYGPALGSAQPPRLSPAEISAALANESALISRLRELKATGYRKIDPIFITEADGTRSLALVFISGGEEGKPHVIGMVLDAERFVTENLARKMDEAAGDNFLLSVNRKNFGDVVYATGDMGRVEDRQTKDLWLFADHSVAIRMKGTTVEDVVRSRFYRNLALIGLLSIVLIAGVWVVYRTVRREVELAQLKADFVSNVSHEIKTPLALIRMVGETLQMKRVTSEKKKQDYYDTIVQESERLTRLINNILSFSRMEAGKKDYHLQPTDVHELVTGVLKHYQTHLEHEGFTVQTDLDRRVPRILADHGAVSEAIVNIIDNAVKYSRQERFLRVSTGVGGSSVFVDIEDHGIGIEQDQQTKIFEKFYRVSTGLTHDTKGTGLGLTLVRHIMDAHHGSVTVRSVVGKGSTFRLSFPTHT